MIYIDDSEPEGVLEPAFPYRDVLVKRNHDANELYEILSEIGRGKFGTVYKCQEKTSGLRLAAKFVPIPKREDKRNVEREVEIMNSLQHHLIIQLYAAYEYQKMMCVVLELVEGGELFDRVVDDEFVLTEHVCIIFIRQVCEAMEFIHRNNILHLDLKPENILCLTQEGNRIKIIDFGLARKFDPDKRLQILFGTPEFVAPEVVNFDCISYGTDMWSVGVICYVLISGLSPFMGETDIETMANVTIAKYDFEDESFSNVSPECLDFISKLLVKDLSTRMTAAQCLEHKWLQRRLKATPVVTPKTKAISPAKLKAATPSPIPPQDDNENEADVLLVPSPVDKNISKAKVLVTDANANGEDVIATKELDTTKDNLKNFIERWEEHPNSPYVFDVEGNVIAPLSETSHKKPHGADSISSSRVCSPSPCESISTITDDDTHMDYEHNEDETAALLTPINESREKLFPSTPSGSETPTPTQYAPEHLFNNRYDPFNQMNNGSNTLPHPRSMKSYLHTFDRRNSDTNYLLGRRASSERVNLADEIRKLSDHLMMLAEINTKLGSDTPAREKKSSKTLTTIDGTNKIPKIKSSQREISSLAKDSTKKVISTASKTSVVTASTVSEKGTKNENSQSAPVTAKTKTKTKTQTHNEDTLGSKVMSGRPSLSPSPSPSPQPPKLQPTPTSTSLSSSSSPSTTLPPSSRANKTKVSSLSIRLQKSIEETPKLLNGTVSTSTAPIKTIKKSTVSTINTANAKSTKPIATETAKTRRAKFRVTQLSRDVPIGLPNTHQPVNLEEAATTTKDCLLHLLEKYNDAKYRNPLSRHQSISVDWNMRDNLEYRSMSSINAFFQRHNNTREHVKQLQAQLQNKVASTGKTKESKAK